MSPRHLGPTYCYYVVFLAYVVITKLDVDNFAAGFWCGLMKVDSKHSLIFVSDSFPEIMMMTIRPAAEQAELPSDIGKVEVLCFRETKFLVSLC